MSQTFNAKEILEDLKSENLKQQIEALSTISSTKKVQQIPKEIIEAIISILENSDKKLLLITALTATQHLATFKRTRQLLGECGAIPFVVNLLSSPDENVQKTALNALSDLAQHAANQVRIAEADGFQPIVAIIQHEFAAFQKQAQALLTKLASNKSCHEKLFDPEVIEPIIILLQVQDDQTRVFTTEFFCNLSTNPNHVQDLAELGAIEPMLEMIASDNIKGLPYALQTIYNMSLMGEDPRKWIGEHSGVKIILQSLKNSKINSERNPEARLALRSIGLNILMKITEETDSLSKEKGTLMANRIEFVENDGIPLIIKIIKEEKNDKIRQAAVQIIANVSYGENTLKVINQEITDLLLNLIVDPESSDELKNIVIEAMCTFATSAECVEKLVEFNAISKLLDLLKKRIQFTSVLNMFTKLNHYSNFQKHLFDSGGLRTLILLLDSKIEEERENGLITIQPFTQTPNGRVVLVKEGVIGRLQAIARSPSERPELVEKARNILKQITKYGDASLRLGLKNATPYKFNYDEIHRIDKEMVQRCQERIRKSLDYKFKVQVNWRNIERLEEEPRNNAISMLAREVVWDELAMAFDILSRDSHCAHAFCNQVKIILINVAPMSVIYIGDLIMNYNIQSDGELMTPKSLAGEISKALIGIDITESNEEVDEDYELAIAELKKVAKDSRIPTLGDINILCFHLDCADHLWKSPFAEERAIIACKAGVLDDDELFIKGWPVIKLNKNGLRQKRYLLLTDTAYYTVCYDPKTKKIDYSHCKHHPLDKFVLVDLGPLVDHPNSRTKKEIENTSSDKNSITYAINIFTNETHKQKRREVEGMEWDDDDETSKQVVDEEDDSDEDLRTATVNVSLMEELGGKISKEEVETRPKTDTLYSNIFVAPSFVPKNKEKLYLQEIAICINTAAMSCQRKTLHEPYNYKILKPEGGLTTFIYNRFVGENESDSRKSTSLEKSSSMRKIK